MIWFFLKHVLCFLLNIIMHKAIQALSLHNCSNLHFPWCNLMHLSLSGKCQAGKVLCSIHCYRVPLSSENHTAYAHLKLAYQTSSDISCDNVRFKSYTFYSQSKLMDPVKGHVKNVCLRKFNISNVWMLPKCQLFHITGWTWQKGQMSWSGICWYMSS